MFDLLLNLLVVYIFSLVLHELGHYYYVKSKGYKVKIVFEDNIVRTEAKGFMTKNVEMGFIMNGVLIGLIPLLIYGLFINPLYFILLFPYAYGCKSDLLQFWSIRE